MLKLNQSIDHVDIPLCQLGLAASLTNMKACTTGLFHLSM